MTKRISAIFPGIVGALATVLMVGCGTGSSSSSGFHEGPPADGSVVAFGTDAPICDVESFVVTITSATLTPQGGGSPVSLITSTNPATVDFARLADFTNILNVASVAPGTYTQLTLSITNPQMIVLNTSATPPAPQPVTVSLTTTSITANLSPALVVTSGATSGLTVDFNLRSSIQVGGTGQVTGTVDPVFNVSVNTNSGSTVGEATALYGVVASTSTSSLPKGFTGSFTLTLQDGTGQSLTVYTTSGTGGTTFEGDGVTSFSELQPNSFVEVDATVNTSGQVVALIVDSEEQVSANNQESAFLGKIIAVNRTGTNATSFTLLVNDEIPSLSATVPFHSGLTVSLSTNTHYFTNWQHWNRQAFTYSPTTLGLAQKVAVFGTLSSGTSPTMAAHQVFLRPRTVTGNFTSLITAGSDEVTGGFTMIPCGGLFGGQAITVLSYANFTNFTNFGTNGDLITLTPGPTIDVFGPFFYEQSNGNAPLANGASWIAPTWVMQARGVRQLPNN